MLTKPVPIKSIKIGDRHRKDMGDLQGLADSIGEVGLLQPIGINPANQLVFGERRLRAAKDILGWKEIPCAVVDVDRIVDGEYAENEVRKDFTTSERVAIAETLNEKIGNRQGQRTDKELMDNCPEVPAGTTTREIVAEKAGFDNYKEYERAKHVVDKGTPELVAAMDNDELPVSVAAKIADLPKAEQRAILKGDREQIRPALQQKVPFSRSLYSELSRIRQNISGIRERFGSFADMVKSKDWDKADTRDVLEMSGMMARELTDLHKELKEHVKGKAG